MQRLPFDSITKNVFFMGNMKSNTFQSGTVQRVGLGPNCRDGSRQVFPGTRRDEKSFPKTRQIRENSRLSWDVP